MRPLDRINLLQKRLKEKQIGCALISYSRDLFYYTGTAQPSYLVVLHDDYYLFVRSGFDFVWNDAFINKEKIRKERSLENIFQQLSSNLQERAIATELDVIPVLEFRNLKKVFSGYEFVDLSPLVLEQRKTKEPSEISRLKEACNVMHEGHNAVLATLREGITELELAAAVENAHRLAGHEGTFFMRHPDFTMSRGPVGSGSNLSKFSGVVYSVTGVGLSPAVPVGPSTKIISKGDLIVVDIVTLVKGYHADQTRTYILGQADDETKSMYNSLKEIADHLIVKIRPGMKCREIYQMAMDKAEEENVTDAFLNFGNGNKSHMIGHGIGLECTEPPIISRYEHSTVKEDYVVALEMHLYRKEVGVVKLEDMILIGKQKNEILTKSARELIEIAC
ncbi:MAG: Xaa-Pro peptidase family protein [Desulfatiglans sp.]|jgi:Xaa-Pro aminopeptidase|nr:Xaa-Pro peptidase family protein [Desulfatiglans sp.]